MGKVLVKRKLQKPTQKETENLNIRVTSKTHSSHNLKFSDKGNYSPR